MPELALAVKNVETPVRRKERLETPIFFMHIAKTAGSYVNERFVDALGEDAVATHIEQSIGNTLDLKAALRDGQRFFSGHVMLGLWDDIAGSLSRKFSMITVLRDPIDHLASHIQWLDQYNNPGRRHCYAALDESHRRIVDRIGAIDLSDIGQLDDYLTGLSGIEVRLFDNCQSRYFIMSGRRDIDCIRPLSLADRSRIALSYSRFDAVACQDQFEMDLSKLGIATGVDLSFTDARVNVAQSERRLDVRHPLIRQVLTKRTIVDQWLWQYVRKKRSQKAVNE
ncbi:MAG: hypothetical protein ACR2OY_07750 [Boseongicola sp.]